MDIINAYNIIHHETGTVLDSFVESKLYRLRKLDDLRDRAIELSLLNQITREIVYQNNIGYEPELYKVGTLINKISLLQTEEPYPVSKMKRKLYEKWLINKSLCTYYENWEKLAYKVCEIVQIDVEAVPVVCDVIVNVGAMEISCITEIIDTYAKEITCDSQVEYTQEQIKCDAEVNVKAIAYDCAKKYDLDAVIIEKILCEAYPNINVIDVDCDTQTNINVLEADNDLSIDCQE